MTMISDVENCKKTGVSYVHVWGPNFLFPCLVITVSWSADIVSTRSKTSASHALFQVPFSSHYFTVGIQLRVNAGVSGYRWCWGWQQPPSLQVSACLSLPLTPSVTGSHNTIAHRSLSGPAAGCHGLTSISVCWRSCRVWHEPICGFNNLVTSWRSCDSRNSLSCGIENTLFYSQNNGTAWW